MLEGNTVGTEDSNSLRNIPSQIVSCLAIKSGIKEEEEENV